MPKGRGKETVKDVMHKYKHGSLHSGSKTGPKVKSRKQAVAIAMHEAGQSKGAKARERKLDGKAV